MDMATQDYLKPVDGNPIVDICKKVLLSAAGVCLFTFCYIEFLEAIIKISGRY